MIDSVLRFATAYIDLLRLVLAAAVALISMCALAVSLLSWRAQRQHNRRSVRPVGDSPCRNQFRASAFGSSTVDAGRCISPSSKQIWRVTNGIVSFTIYPLTPWMGSTTELTLSRRESGFSLEAS